MKKIFVKYKDITLGELTFNNGLFNYEVNIKNVEKAQVMGYPVMLFNINKNFISATLPFSLEDLIPNENTILYKQACITQKDDNFEKLYKVALLNLDDNGFYISTI